MSLTPEQVIVGAFAVAAIIAYLLGRMEDNVRTRKNVYCPECGRNTGVQSLPSGIVLHCPSCGYNIGKEVL